MQTSRLLPAIAAIVLCASTFSTRADDTPAQAAARAALMQDMNETGNAETPTPPPATPTQPPVIVPPPTPPPAPVIPPPSNPPPVTAAPESQATQPIAAQGSSTNLVLPPVEQETIPTNQVTQYPVNPASSTMWPSASTNSAAAQATAATALTGQANGNNEPPVYQTAPPMTPATTPGAANEAPTAPPVPLTDSQRQQLQALLQQYEANQITPAQYQDGRAKILAGQ